MRRIRERNFYELIVAKPNNTKTRLRSVHNYDILTNPFYSDKFLYVPATYPERWDYTISQYSDNYLKCYSSDIVRLAVDFAYMPINEMSEVQFDEQYIFKRMLQLREKNQGDAQIEVKGTIYQISDANDATRDNNLTSQNLLRVSELNRVQEDLYGEGEEEHQTEKDEMKMRSNNKRASIGNFEPDGTEIPDPVSSHDEKKFISYDEFKTSDQQ